MVGSALCALLEGSGYRITPLDAHPTGVADDLLEGAELLLLAPRLDAEAREAFVVGAMGKRVPQRADTPVVELRTDLEQAPLEEEIIGVPWPCETRVLVERIEAALAGAPAADPYQATGRG